MSTFIWKKDFFSSIFRIYGENRELFGYVKIPKFSNKTFISIDNTDYMLVPKSFLSSSIYIFQEDNKIGYIVNNIWTGFYTIYLGGNTYQFSSKIWKNKWKIKRDKITIVESKGSLTQGNIQLTFEEKLLMFLGLILNNNKWIYIGIVFGVLTCISLKHFIFN